MDANDLQQALGYLGPLGYIADPEEPDPVVERFGFSLTAVPVQGALDESRITAALLTFQERNGLELTGELDEATIALMNTPRCGVPDIFEYSVWGTKWGITNLTYAVAEGAREMTIAQTEAGLREAFDAWAAVTPLTFRQVSIGDRPNILIRFVTGDHQDGNPFDGPSGVLAHAYMPIHGGMHFDEAEVWTLNTSGGIHFVTVAMHEIGHLLGLLHSTVQDALMAPYYRGPAPRLHSDDVAGIQYLYGAKPALPPPPPPPTPDPGLDPAPPPTPAPGPFPPVAPNPPLAWIP